VSGPTSARPTGVAIVAVLALIAGVLGLVASATIFGLGGNMAVVSGLITLAISVAVLAMGYGFWMLRPGSWRLAAVLAVVNPLWEIARFLFRGADPLNLIVAIACAAIWLYYLNLPAMRATFRAPVSGFPVIGNLLDPVLGGRR
jgi:hypothetical protein